MRRSRGHESPGGAGLPTGALPGHSEGQGALPGRTPALFPAAAFLLTSPDFFHPTVILTHPGRSKQR